MPRTVDSMEKIKPKKLGGGVCGEEHGELWHAEVAGQRAHQRADMAKRLVIMAKSAPSCQAV